MSINDYIRSTCSMLSGKALGLTLAAVIAAPAAVKADVEFLDQYRVFASEYRQAGKLSDQENRHMYARVTETLDRIQDAIRKSKQPLIEEMDSVPMVDDQIRVGYDARRGAHFSNFELFVTAGKLRGCLILSQMRQMEEVDGDRNMLRIGIVDCTPYSAWGFESKESEYSLIEQTILTKKGKSISLSTSDIVSAQEASEVLPQQEAIGLQQYLLREAYETSKSINRSLDNWYGKYNDIVDKLRSTVRPVYEEVRSIVHQHPFPSAPEVVDVKINANDSVVIEAISNQQMLTIKGYSAVKNRKCVEPTAIDVKTEIRVTGAKLTHQFLIDAWGKFSLSKLLIANDMLDGSEIPLHPGYQLFQLPAGVIKDIETLALGAEQGAKRLILEMCETEIGEYQTARDKRLKMYGQMLQDFLDHGEQPPAPKEHRALQESDGI